MKNFRKTINHSFDRLDNKWRRLPVHKQQRYMLLLFVVYLLLTITVIISIWYEMGTPKKGRSIEHIENPIIKKSTS